MAEENTNAVNNTSNIPEEVSLKKTFVGGSLVNNMIKVVGVGGGGSNAISHMFDLKVPGVGYVVCNTDLQALKNSHVPTKLLIGPETTRGLGAGNKPEIARKAALESRDEIAALFDDDTRMVFITAGMGGGTGTGASPVVAQLAREKGILTIGIVTIPFLFEGRKKILKAIDGAEELKKYVDAILIINNERLCEIYSNLAFTDAFFKADDTLAVAASSISELINCDGIINLDFNDIHTTLADSGVAVISNGIGEGENRVTKAIENALESPLLKNRDIESSKRILINIYYSNEANDIFSMSEVREVTAFMNRINPEIDLIWGTAVDNSLGDQIKVTVLASGFDVTNSDLDSTQKSDPTPVPPRPPRGGYIGNSGRTQRTEPSNPIMDTNNSSQTDADTQLIVNTYGTERMKEFEREKAKAKYIVLSPEDFDNAEVLKLFLSKPTFNRNISIKDAVRTALAKAKTFDIAKPISSATSGVSNDTATIVFE